MKSIILVALALVAIAAAAPVEEPIPILKSSFDTKPEGYEFHFETGNGIKRQENGDLKEILDEENKPHQVVVVRGTYTYTDNDGNVETVEYKADEEGFSAVGPSIPKPTRR